LALRNSSSRAARRRSFAGVASIEHGSLLDDEAIQMMKQRGTYLVADVYNKLHSRDEIDSCLLLGNVLRKSP
jgi:imidazolonepropionase-like amidohydrolase